MKKLSRQAVAGIMLTVMVLALAVTLYAPTGATRSASALDNGLAQTPPMGWNSWNRFGCKIDEQLIRDTADALVNTGLRDAGYQYVIVDECWQTGRGGDGLIHASTRTFPSGMAALAAYVHERGLKFGIYTDAGSYTCQGRPGSLGYEFQDAATYAAWGVDYVKIDWCFTDGLDAARQYQVWRDAIAATGRPMLISISEWGENAPWDWAVHSGNMWRTSTDLTPDWAAILRNLDQTAWTNAGAGPGGWSDPDMLQVGNGSLTLDEQKAHFSMWALLAAPLIAGNDIRSMSPETGAILANHEIIAVDQDAAGIPGMIVDDTGTGLQVWMKPLADGSRAVALLNRADVAAPIMALWAKLGLAPDVPVVVRDLWAHADLGTFQGSLQFEVPAHGVMMLRLSPLTPQAPPPDSVPAIPDAPAGEQVRWLGDMTWSEVQVSYGPPEVNASNGEDAAGDGSAMLLNGQRYERGIGTQAPSQIVYDLGASCSTFQADLGVDDEVGDNGSVTFEVWGDGILLYASGVLIGAQSPLPVSVDIRGVWQLRLVVSDGGDGVA
ncbi:MAG TPA: NPCBM/NEW2 domain-containing protein, partial [Roseiflexaceae bacterium]|nr:NPCBM/NEW2 domain-containing protein [Roseiflexaceae bacterium]